MKKEKGFTLIELLVVIAIIGILSSIIFVSIKESRSKTRDAKRLTEKKQVITAMNLYYTDNGTWPPVGFPNDWTCVGPSGELCFGNARNGSNTLVSALQPYLSVVPVINANTGSIAYNRLLYHRSFTSVPDPSFRGAYLVWFQENQISTSMCPSYYAPGVFNGWWYCYEFLGP